MGLMSDMQEQCDDAIAEGRRQAVHRLGMPIPQAQVSDMRETFLNISRDWSTMTNLLEGADNPQDRAMYEMLEQEAKQRFFMFRRDVANVFLFMLRAAGSEFPADIQTVVARAVGENLIENLTSQVTRLHKENNSLRMRVIDAEKRIEELMVIWNSTFAGK